MAFPVSPTEGQTFTENNTVWIYSAVSGQWNRSVINPLNETLYKFGGSASATGAAGEIQYTDGTNLAASPNLVWDDVNDELEVGGDVVLDDGGTFTTTLQTITATANRTISLPDATGTVALVAGSSGQLVYNNAGAQAGVPSSGVSATGNITLSLNGALSGTGIAGVPVAVTGTWVTSGGTSATTKPQVLIEPTGTSSTWSTSGTGLGVNAASGFAGNLLDLKINGTSHFRVRGDTVTTATILQSNSISSPSGYFEFSSSGISATTLFRLGGSYGAWDVGLARAAAGVFKVTDGSTGDGTISGQHRLVGTAPASATATGTAGDIRYDADYIYICTATNTWKRAAISTW